MTSLHPSFPSSCSRPSPPHPLSSSPPPTYFPLPPFLPSHLLLLFSSPPTPPSPYEQTCTQVFPTHRLICGGAPQNQHQPPHIAFRKKKMLTIFRLKPAAYSFRCISFPWSPSVCLSLMRLYHIYTQSQRQHTLATMHTYAVLVRPTAISASLQH